MLVATIFSACNKKSKTEIYDEATHRLVITKNDTAIILSNPNSDNARLAQYFHFGGTNGSYSKLVDDTILPAQAKWIYPFKLISDTIKTSDVTFGEVSYYNDGKYSSPGSGSIWQCRYNF